MSMDVMKIEPMNFMGSILCLDGAWAILCTVCTFLLAPYSALTDTTIIDVMKIGEMGM
jgi:hypothetical protein